MSNTLPQSRREPKHRKTDAIVLAFPGSDPISDPDTSWMQAYAGDRTRRGLPCATPELLAAGMIQHWGQETMEALDPSFAAAGRGLLARVTDRSVAILHPALP